jgi:DNA adenine methylase
VLIALLRAARRGEFAVKAFCAFDINPYLIHCYTQIQNNVHALIDSLSELAREYESLNNLSAKEEFYYKRREEYNDRRDAIEPARLAALFIFLNKTGFRGLYRESRGKYNVPFGHYKAPSVFDPSHLLELHELFERVTFCASHFGLLFDTYIMSRRDFVYMDPPYYPVKKTSFVGYGSGFGEAEHAQLRDIICRLAPTQCLVSNSWCEWTQTNYAFLHCKKILCRRAIHSKQPSAQAYEILAANFPLK